MGKIKNDFQIWMGNNHREVLRGGSRLNLSLSDVASYVEAYIIATADRLKALERDRTGVLPNRPASSLSENETEQYPDAYDGPVYGGSPLHMTPEEIENIRRLMTRE